MLELRLIQISTLDVVGSGDSEVVSDTSTSDTAQGTKKCADNLVISQIKTFGIVDGGANHPDEFVEIYNPLTTNINLDGYKVQYKSATGNEWKDLANLSGKIIGSGKFLLIASDMADLGGLNADIIYASNQLGLSASGGNIRIINAGGNVIDMVAWGSGNSPEGSSITAPIMGGSIIRKAKSDSNSESMKSGGADEKGGHGVDTDNNANDFVLLDVAEPNNSNSPAEPSLCVK